jgi:hypothetical protein
LIKGIYVKWEMQTKAYVDELLTHVLNYRFHQVRPVTDKGRELETNGKFVTIHEIRVGKPIEEHSGDESESEESE